jgi:hypothetical protein
MTKILINICHGGFCLSKEVFEELGIPYDDSHGFLENKDLGISGRDFAYRADPRLIAAVEKIGYEKAGGRLTDLEIVEIPDDVEWEIQEYDGWESIHEKHRSW